MERGTLVVRADAGLKIGTGHVMRCLALAQSWRAGGGKVIFALAQSTPALDDLLRSEKIDVVAIEGAPGSSEDARNAIRIAQGCNADWFMVDGYHFDAAYQKDLQSFRPLLTIDDNGLLDHYAADLVLNQNAHACAPMYAHHSPNTKLLLGPRYALLRDEFAGYRDWVREIPDRGLHLLLTMGGSDASNFAPRILPLLWERGADELQIRVVVGGSAENAEAVDEIAAKSFPERVFPGCLSPAQIEVLRDARNMAPLMAWADLAISGAGTTCWEMCAMGLPAILVVVAENQRSIAEQLAAIGAVENAGPADQIDCAALADLCGKLLASKDRRASLSQKAKQVVDGRGRDRVLDMMKCGDEMCA
ncbi:MAG: UDP-2,4-diacetamido-2,4,6-trideoxy-beta-L-altropyranose hydrolase [Terriglobales bacterium]